MVYKEGLFWHFDKKSNSLSIEVPCATGIVEEEITSIKAKKYLDNGAAHRILILDADGVKSLRITANEANTRLIAITIERRGSSKIQVDL